MNLEEFNPPKPELDINGKTISFKLFTLYHKAWASLAFSTKENTNGLINLAEGLRILDPLIISKFAWRLVENKKDIDEEEFYNFAERRQNILKILEVINIVLEKSQPSTKVNERMRELKKS